MIAAQSLRGRAHMAQSLCALAEAQLAAGRPVLTRATLREMHEVLAGIAALVECDTSSLPSGTLRETAEMLVEISGRVAAIEARLGSTTIH